MNNHLKKIPAGFFLPSMVVGAALGRAVGILVQQTYRLISFLFLSPLFFFKKKKSNNIRVNPEAFNFACGTSETCIIPGVYAIIGAASVLCGISRTPSNFYFILFF